MRRCLLVLLVAGSVASPASAALISRLGGMAVYDTDLDITWTANANIALTETFGISGIDSNGTMTWFVATEEWLPALNAVGGTGYLGFNDWRLPKTNPVDPTCSHDVQGGVDGGYGCTGSELGHLYYVELGGTANNSILTSGDPDLALFQNLNATGDLWGFWSTPCCVVDGDEWVFYTYFDFGASSGSQGPGPKTFPWFAPWAVRDGDVAAVPEPSVLLLLVAGLVGMRFRRRGLSPGSELPHHP